jgi:thiamine phosphate synthase YjbQ (UPF0047 family)
MDFRTGKFQFNTKGNSDIIDLTIDVENAIKENGFRERTVVYQIMGIKL